MSNVSGIDSWMRFALDQRLFVPPAAEQLRTSQRAQTLRDDVGSDPARPRPNRLEPRIFKSSRMNRRRSTLRPATDARTVKTPNYRGARAVHPAARLILRCFLGVDFSFRWRHCNNQYQRGCTNGRFHSLTPYGNRAYLAALRHPAAFASTSVQNHRSPSPFVMLIFA
jgi:hypothetical protein